MINKEKSVIYLYVCIDYVCVVVRIPLSVRTSHGGFVVLPGID